MNISLQCQIILRNQRVVTIDIDDDVIASVLSETSTTLCMQQTGDWNPTTNEITSMIDIKLYTEKRRHLPTFLEEYDHLLYFDKPTLTRKTVVQHHIDT